MCGCKKKTDAEKLREKLESGCCWGSKRAKAKSFYNALSNDLNNAVDNCESEVTRYLSNSQLENIDEIQSVLSENGFSSHVNCCSGKLTISF